MAPLIELKDIRAGYDKNIILEDINLSVFQNDFIGIIGPNGGGKTTLLKIILNLLEPLSGHIYKAPELKTGYLPQINTIDRHFPITVEDVILSGHQSSDIWRQKPTKAQRSKVNELLTFVNLNDALKVSIGELSGGQMQRVFLCRALFSEPNLLILDEPNTYVDKTFEGYLYNTLSELNDKMAILLVTHDVGTVVPLVKSIACVNGDLHYHPSNKITNEILKSYNCPIEIISHGTIPHRVLKDHSHE